MRRNHRIVWAVCLACVMSATIEQGGAADDTRITGITQRCKAAGWEDATIGKLEGLLADGSASGLDMDLLTLRLQEGLAKKADPAMVVQAVGYRLGAMKQARQLTQAHDGPSAQLEQTVGFALEAGLSAETIRGILASGSNQRPGQLVALIDAGRTLVLSGWDEKAASGLTTDFQERNLRRGEMIRALRTLVEIGPTPPDQLPTVRARLWGGHGTPGGNAPASGRQGVDRLTDPGSRNGTRRGGQGGSGNGAHQ